MIIDNCIQGEEQWHKNRIGNPGATGFSNIITSTGQPSKSREKYLYQMAEETITGEKPETFQNAAMARGIELEPKAREVFQMVQRVNVDEVGMIYPDEAKRYHISPDGIMPEKKEGLEIKCPSLMVHDKYCQKGVCPTEYRLQVQGSMMVTGYETWWFVSFFPGLKPLILPVKRDNKLIAVLRHEMDLFIDDLDNLVTRLKA